MPDTPSITIVKRFTYRGDPNEEFSNTYHFLGDTPANDAGWKTLADAVIAQEKTIVPSTVSFVRAYGYKAGQEFAESVIDYTAPPNTIVQGTWTVAATGMEMPGDVAFWVRWRTGKRNSKGKWIYCRKYFHKAYGTNSDIDALVGSQKTAAAAYAAKMVDGTLPGGFKVCTPQGDVGVVPFVGPRLTTRTLKRRGKRPSS